jgi:hypothetical protein
VYYIVEFGDLRMRNGEYVSYFTKRFNKMYNKIPDGINPIETSAKIAFENAFDAKFSLMLGERRSTTFLSM